MAAEGGHVWDISAASSGSLTSSQFYFVKLAAQDVVALCTGSSQGSARAFGVLQNDPDSGQAAQVRKLGLTKLVAGGSIAVGDWIACSTGGTGLSAGTTGQFCVAVANSASTAAGQIIEAFMLPHGFLYNANGTA